MLASLDRTLSVTNQSFRVMQPPIFICGSPRSGTTLVSQILNAHPDVTIFDEVNLLDVARLWERFHSQREQVALAGTSVSESDFYERAMQADSPTALLSALLFDGGESSQRWGEKYPDYANTVDEVQRLFPGSVMVFVLRDPRAILASMLRYKGSSARSTGDFWIVDNAKDGIEVLKNSAAQYSNIRDKVVPVRYELIVSEPAKAIPNLCNAVGLTFRPEMLAPKPGPLPGSALTSQFVRNGVELPWKNSNRSEISGDIVDKWRGELDDTFWASIEDEIEPVMRAFGYTFEDANPRRM
jgi:hypothetical protein